MHLTDKDKTTFTIGHAIYCYKVMSFGLKNAGATFQWMVNEIFKEIIIVTMEVYYDDMLVKSLDRSDHVKHLGEEFALICKFNKKLNLKKCTFRVASDKFLGYLVTQ